MNFIEFGDEAYTGEITYIPVVVEDEITDYFLIAYGSEESNTDDLDGDGVEDHAVLVLGGPSSVPFTVEEGFDAEMLRELLTGE